MLNIIIDLTQSIIYVQSEVLCEFQINSMMLHTVAFLSFASITERHKLL